MQKVLQRSLFSFLQSRLGLGLLVVGALLCLNTTIGLLRLLVTTSTSPLCPHCAHNDYADTLGSGHDAPLAYRVGALQDQLDSYEPRLCYEPIDVVYTSERMNKHTAAGNAPRVHALITTTVVHAHIYWPVSRPL
jgi:hypothetical protein